MEVVLFISKIFLTRHRKSLLPFVFSAGEDIARKGFIVTFLKKMACRSCCKKGELPAKNTNNVKKDSWQNKKSFFSFPFLSIFLSESFLRFGQKPPLVLDVRHRLETCVILVTQSDLRDMFLQKVHSDRLLVALCKDSFAIPLDHTGFTHCAIANDHNLKEEERNLFRHKVQWWLQTADGGGQKSK